jgi:hypothetical protein
MVWGFCLWNRDVQYSRILCQKPLCPCFLSLSVIIKHHSDRCQGPGHVGCTVLLETAPWFKIRAPKQQTGYSTVFVELHSPPSYTGFTSGRHRWLYFFNKGRIMTWHWPPMALSTLSKPHSHCCGWHRYQEGIPNMSSDHRTLGSPHHCKAEPHTRAAHGTPRATTHQSLIEPIKSNTVYPGDMYLLVTHGDHSKW